MFQVANKDGDPLWSPHPTIRLSADPPDYGRMNAAPTCWARIVA